MEDNRSKQSQVDLNDPLSADPKPMRLQMKYIGLAFGLPGVAMCLGAIASLLFGDFVGFFGLLIFGGVFVGAGWLIYKLFGASDHNRLLRLIGGTNRVTGDVTSQAFNDTVRVISETGHQPTTGATNPLDFKPWAYRPDWINGEITEKGPRGLWIWIFFIIVLNALCLGLSAVFYFENPESPDWIAIVPSLGMALAGNFILIKRMIHEARFAPSRLILNDVPIEPGNYMQATLKTGVKAKRFKSQLFSASLVCVREADASYRIAGAKSGEKQTRSDTQKMLVWNETKNIQGSGGNDGFYELKLVFQLPEDQPISNATIDGGTHIWLIRVEADVLGPDYKVEFEIPVFNKAEID